MRDTLQRGCLVAGVLCILYYGIILCYAGIRTSAAFLWPLLGGIFLFLNRILHWQSLHPKTFLRYVAAALLILMAVGLAVALAVGCHVVKGMLKTPRGGLSFVIVLGAQVRGTEPSLELRRRLDTAAEYAAENPETIFVLSGGQGTDEEISEAECMYRYLTEQKGLDSSRLLLEDQSSSTQENLQFSAHYLDMTESVGILSSNFHICRALALARTQGYADPVGLPSPSGLLMLPHNFLREICALLVEKMLGQI